MGNHGKTWTHRMWFNSTGNHRKTWIHRMWFNSIGNHGIYIYQLGFTGAVQFRDGTLDPSDVRVKCPISESIPSTRIKHKIRDNVTGYMLVYLKKWVIALYGRVLILLWIVLYHVQVLFCHRWGFEYAQISQSIFNHYISPACQCLLKW